MATSVWDQDPDFKQLKVIKSHTGLARFMAELKRTEATKADPNGIALEAGWIRQPPHIRTPYSYGIAQPVFAWGDHFVWIAETEHKVFRIFTVNPRLVRNTEDQVFLGTHGPSGTLGEHVPDPSPTALAADAAYRARAAGEEQARLEGIWQDLMTAEDKPSVAAKLSPAEAKVFLDRLDAAPGTNAPARAALVERSKW